MIEKKNVWKQSILYYDRARKSEPNSIYSFKAVEIFVEDSIIATGFSSNKSNAIKQAETNYRKKDKSFKRVKQQFKEKKTLIAFNSAVHSFNDLYIDFYRMKGYYAGLPWFFHIWTRDEAISLKALILLGEYEKLEQIFLNRIKNVVDGRIGNRYPHSVLGTADGSGWFFKRLHEFLESESIPEKKRDMFRKTHLATMKKYLKKIVEKQKKDYISNYLVWNRNKETWMDTSYGKDGRSGYRIEIQALWCCILKFQNYLDEIDGKPDNETLEKTKKRIKETFFVDGELCDGKNDPTSRPNVFLAYYLMPELLTALEWNNVFDRALEKLWLDWGGLATIEKKSKLFCKRYTGQDNRSYHRGDSWFFINNIAAICLNRLNKKKYGKYIKKIENASIQDILWEGSIGRPSELSSAEKQISGGTEFQLWSAATLIELLLEQKATTKN